MKRLAVSGVVAAALAGCGGSPADERTLDTEKVASAIAASIKDQRRLDAQVVCPAGIPQREGYKFACLATYDGGQNTFTVTETDDEGHVSYRGR